MAKKKKIISVLEAVDNLSNLAELDAKQGEASWFDPHKSHANEEKIKETFNTLNTYLHHLYERERGELKDVETQKGIAAMMKLAGEAAKKIENYTGLFEGALNQEGGISEYQQLQQFYLSKIVSGMEKQKGREEWEKEALTLSEQGVDLERQALKNLEIVRKDEEYELFYIRKEDGMAFYHPNLVRHIRLVGHFDESQRSHEAEDLFERLKVTLDKDLNQSAKDILLTIGSEQIAFYQQAFKHKGATPFVAFLNQAMMALMLAANPKNLIHNTTGKSSKEYFADFQFFLRRALENDIYRENRWESEVLRLCLQLARKLCYALFLHVGAREEVLNLIGRIYKGKEKKADTFWTSLISIDEVMRAEFRALPSGPLLQTLEMFRNNQEWEGFDPLIQFNSPAELFTIASESLRVEVLYLPTPTRQSVINEAYIVPEFEGYLDYLDNEKHLLINLQDSTSWREHARCRALEKEGKKNLAVITLSVDTDFYHQRGEYAEIENSTVFKETLSEQLNGGDQCGFHLPKELKNDTTFSKIADFIHSAFFEESETLDRKQRLDFLELFYHFSVLYAVMKITPRTLSFTSKDGVDTASCLTAGFYGICRMLSSSAAWSERDRDFFLFSLYSPALLHRHRLLESIRYHRELSALEYADSKLGKARDKILRACAEILPDLPIKNWKSSQAA